MCVIRPCFIMLQYARTVSFANINKNTPPRIGAAKIVVLLTDGRNNKGPNPITEALKLKNSGATIIVVGIGSGINIPELKLISTANYVYTTSQFNQLNNLLSQIVALLYKGII